MPRRAGRCQDRLVHHRPRAGLELPLGYPYASRCRDTHARGVGVGSKPLGTNQFVRSASRDRTDHQRPVLPAIQTQTNADRRTSPRRTRACSGRDPSRQCEIYQHAPCRRTRSCAVQKVRAWPRCKNPVGDGASRPRYGVVPLAFNGANELSGTVGCIGAASHFAHPAATRRASSVNHRVASRRDSSGDAKSGTTA